MTAVYSLKVSNRHDRPTQGARRIAQAVAHNRERVRAIRHQSPDEPAGNRRGSNASTLKSLCERAYVGGFAPPEFLGVDPGGEKQAINAERPCTLEISANRIADRQRPLACNCTPTHGFRLGQSLQINRRIRLS